MSDEEEVEVSNEEAFAFHLARASVHIVSAINCAGPRGLRRSFAVQRLLTRADAIVTSLWNQEQKRRRTT